MAYDITVTTSALPVVESRARAGSSTRLAQVTSIVRAHGEGLGAAAVYAAFALWALVPAAKMLEPDDYAYRASIIALSQGHFWLTNTQYTALAKSLSGGIQQWVHLANGHWISEKNPGYPFFAVVFQWLRIVRLTPLFYGAIGSAALYCGARRWLGRRGGLFAVVLYCSAGAAMVFAWRATMPTFTDASLIAAGAGALLWTLLAVEASARRRTVVGLMGFVALEGATFIRYTDVVELAVAVAAVCVFARSARLRWRNVVWWLSSVALFGGLVLVFDALVYGGATRTGYSSGEITFSTSALVPNLENMPLHLLRAMPLALIAAGAVIWIVARLVMARRAETGEASLRRRDASVAGSLLAGWLGIWGLYAAYNWTVTMGAGGVGSDVHVVRFYVPALGLMALLGAWLLTRIPGWFALGIVAVLVTSGGYTYQQMATSGLGPGGGFPGGGPGGSGGRLPGGGRGGPPGGIPGGRPPGGGRGRLPGGAPGTKAPGGAHAASSRAGDAR